jgi:hypothetical protein
MPDDTCPHCGHEWRRHDPEDGRCDAHSAEQGVFGPCRCGRDVAFTAVANARLSRAALDCVRDARGEDEGRVLVHRLFALERLTPEWEQALADLRAWSMSDWEPDRVRDARGDDEAALGSMWTIMQTQFERGRIPECHGPTRNDARKMLAGFRRVAARDARGDDEADTHWRWRMVCKVCGWRSVWHEGVVTGGVVGDCPQCGACDWTDEGDDVLEAARSPQGEDHEAEVVGRIVRFLVDAGCEAAAAMVEVEFGRPPSE